MKKITSILFSIFVLAGTLPETHGSNCPKLDPKTFLEIIRLDTGVIHYLQGIRGGKVPGIVQNKEDLGYTTTYEQEDHFVIRVTHLVEAPDPKGCVYTIKNTKGNLLGHFDFIPK